MYKFIEKEWAVTAVYFRRLPYIMTDDKQIAMLFAKIKKKYQSSKYKKTAPFFLLSEDQKRRNLSVCIHLYKAVLLKQYLS